MKITVQGIGCLPTSGKAPEVYKTTQAIATGLGYPPKLHCKTLLLNTLYILAGYPPKLYGKTLLLNTLHTLAARNREINLKLTWKLPSCWLAFIAKYGATQVSGKEINGLT